MPNYIKPTFTLTANKNSVTSGTKGPLSVALSLTASGNLAVDNVRSEILTVPWTADSDAATLLIDGSAYTPGTGGTNGGYVFMKNTTTTAGEFIYIGVHPPGLEDIDDASDDHRFMTLKPNEWAFFPFDYTQDISVDSSAASQVLEYWIFDRG